ncbi:unnamed protein product [Clonostachys solani]|uniref:NAD-dependent epimerase/dehydratase domain-containing protein n=1 Tax=Clonostachys solani TaxID=160281 RepID=A0A9N9Z129_9HYPO|nr:unnamed protein product [Clonostachys solani]
MKILITGASGFVGQNLVQHLLDDESGQYSLVLTDIVLPTVPKGVKWPDKAKCIQADLFSDAAAVVYEDIDAVYMFHGIMSSAAEADFDLGMRVNVDSTRSLLEVLRKTRPGVKVIYTSAGAVHGGKITEPVTEGARTTPQSSYGCEKMICEYLINEYHRRGFINALVFRLPSISVRAGKPTAAASSFISGIIREPMQGLPCVVPIKDRQFKHTICTPRTLAYNLIYALSIPRDALPDYDRVVNMPGLLVTVQDLLDSLVRVGGEDKLQYITEVEDPKVKAILYSWATAFDPSKGLKLGLKIDQSFDDAVRDFKDTL